MDNKVTIEVKADEGEGFNTIITNYPDGTKIPTYARIVNLMAITRTDEYRTALYRAIERIAELEKAAKALTDCLPPPESSGFRRVSREALRTLLDVIAKAESNQ